MTAAGLRQSRLGVAGTILSVDRGSERVVLVYNRGDFTDPSVVPAFEGEYGIKVNHGVYDGTEQLEPALLAGH